MIGFAVLTFAIARVGYAAAKTLWRKLDEDDLLQTPPAELLAAGSVLGFALWLAVSWSLALTHELTRPALLTAAALFVILAVLSLIPVPRMTRPHLSLVWLAALIPIGCWIAYVLWRGTLLPPDSHDALAYHLPKAVFITRAHGYEYFTAPDSRIATFPSNYELLLADLLLMARSDQLSEWISTVTYILFLVVTAAIMERWWGRGPHVPIAVLLTAATPVLLLHSGADKNDLMSGYFAAAALLWGARWFARGGIMPWLLLIVTLVAGAGTKPQQAAIFIGISPFLLARAVRLGRSLGVRWKPVVSTIAGSAAVFALCGGAPYVFDAFYGHGRLVDAGVNGLEAGTASIYGDWTNLWQFPYLLLTAPFSSDPLSVWVPWRHQRWFWPKYELYFSNYGILFTLATMALPFCIWRYGRDGDDATQQERLSYSVAALIGFLLILPVVFRPFGFFAGSGRYVVFVIPAVIGWTVASAIRELGQRDRAAVAVIAGGMALYFFVTAADVAVNDRFSPFEYAWIAAHQSNPRWIWFASVTSERAGTVVDRLAGPDDVIAVDGGFDAWLYPAMGANQTRRIEFISPGPGTVQIPADAQWVIVDRAWHIIWGNPQFSDFGGFWRYQGKGHPTPQDRRVLEALLADRRFEPVYYNSRLNQAVFRRRVH
jgi:hypothetical protein